MVQIYFLGVAFNLLCGFALLVPDRPHPRHLLRHMAFVFSDVRFRIALGVLGLLTGALLVLSPIEGDVPFVGDIVPALTAALSGLVLLLELHPVGMERSGPSPDSSGQSGKDSPNRDAGSERRLRAILVGSGKIIGLFAILAGVVHFLFPLELFF